MIDLEYFGGAGWKDKGRTNRVRPNTHGSEELTKNERFRNNFT